MSAILGGLFNSRLNRKLREEKGYTYGAGAGFDLRRGRGPFAARAAVNTEVTVPALQDMLAELDRIREAPVDRRASSTPRATSSSACSRSGSRRRARSSGRSPAWSSTACRTTSWTATGRRSRRSPRTTSSGSPGRTSSPTQAAIVLVGDADAFGAGARGRGHRARSP